MVAPVLNDIYSGNSMNAETGKAGGDVEPGIGVRLEDVVLKTEDGYEILGGGLAQSPWEP